ncbi:hypothetical protein BDW02DRAFT_573273 [Decorospora gaudefroyi]|uniref:Uncharacterized protein n=1 Tax=Decorospora gaudefroyi TaxID=184978 RepID=A0A6A5K6U8_9PLEO|nr:hypothetical protein BDW02DRAFT_573273 [Decorospora gaudefroyi]
MRSTHCVCLLCTPNCPSFSKPHSALVARISRPHWVPDIVRIQGRYCPLSITLGRSSLVYRFTCRLFTLDRH